MVGKRLLDMFPRFPLVFQGFDPFGPRNFIVFAGVR